MVTIIEYRLSIQKIKLFKMEIASALVGCECWWLGLMIREGRENEMCGGGK